VALFSRKRRTTPAPSSSSTSKAFIGRKFSSDLSIDECLVNFSKAASDCYPTSSELIDVEWRAPSDVDGVPSTQGGPAPVPPARFVALDLARSGRLFLAIWDGYVGRGNDGVSGQAREMWFVPRDSTTRRSRLPARGRCSTDR
jgi:hypothetical protein